ncbi:hypothetical protein FRC09_010893 [Ceratobasidium sp. 395]|nr:hypothetical protein FRC09_010893 [Ceratobasidium sp. 395]
MDDDKDGKVYCHHCNKYKDKRTRFRHLRKLSLELAAAEDNGAGTGTGTMDKTTSDSDSSSDNDSTMDSETHLDNEPDDGNEDMELDNNATNGKNLDISHGNFFNFDAEEYLSDTPSTPRSWFNIGTPLPSPPLSPFQLPDDNVSENEDGYIDLTAEDYCEYDCWYAEDSQTELDEMTRFKKSNLKYSWSGNKKLSKPFNATNK